MTNTNENSADVAAVEQWGNTYQGLKKELSKVIIGQEDVIEQVVIAMMARGHALIEGVPGLAKTLMIHSISEAMDLSFHRIQFTPDLMPSDITGTDVLQEDPITHERSYEFVKGPIFANLVLADEINRTPPKTQAAMLESMQERMISMGGRDFKLPEPFFVLATQNPLEQEGTYPLPEAQLDRFLLYIKIGYPSDAEEWDIARKVTSGGLGDINAVLKSSQIQEGQALVQRMPACDQVVGYATSLVRASRPNADGSGAPESIAKWVNWGSGPRGALALISCAKSRALIQGRFHATVEDIDAVMLPALRHRIAPNYAAVASGINSEQIIEMLKEHVPSDKEYAHPAGAAS